MYPSPVVRVGKANVADLYVQYQGLDVQMVVAEGMSQWIEGLYACGLATKVVQTPAAGIIGCFDLGKTPQPLPNSLALPALQPNLAVAIAIAIDGAANNKRRGSYR